jgi:hypothetical protein
MIASMHVADVGLMRAPRLLARTPQPDRTPGLVYADMLAAAKLGPAILPRPRPSRVALFAVWRDDAALDRFLVDDPISAALAPGSSVRLRPVRVSGAWTGLPSLVETETETEPSAAGDEDDEPVAVLTYGRLKLHRLASFLVASARAEADVVEHPALVSGTGLTRLPRLVSTFSLWRSAAAMRDYAHHGAGHTAALRAVGKRDFHHESIFIRFRPYAATGDWTAG